MSPIDPDIVKAQTTKRLYRGPRDAICQVLFQTRGGVKTTKEIKFLDIPDCWYDPTRRAVFYVHSITATAKDDKE